MVTASSLVSILSDADVSVADAVVCRRLMTC